jgi:hypothetical protein
MNEYYIIDNNGNTLLLPSKMRNGFTYTQLWMKVKKVFKWLEN